MEENQSGNQTEASQTFSVPAEYASKGWASSVKSADDLWKLTDNAQSLIGKRPAGIPAHDAPDEEWNKFYNVMRPEKPEAYKFSDVKDVPEGFDIEGTRAQAAKILHEAGLNQRQADKVWQMYMDSTLGSYKAMQESKAAQDAELDKQYDEITKQHFGDKYDDAAKQAQDLINKYTPEPLRGAFGDMADKPALQASVIAALSGAYAEIEKIKAEYGKEGSLASGGQVSADSMEDVRRELANLRISKEARDFTHPDHKKAMGKISELEGKVNRYFNK